LNPSGGSRARKLQIVVTPSRSAPAPPGSVDLVEEGRSVLSERRTASGPKSDPCGAAWCGRPPARPRCDVALRTFLWLPGFRCDRRFRRSDRSISSRRGDPCCPSAERRRVRNPSPVARRGADANPRDPVATWYLGLCCGFLVSRDSFFGHAPTIGLAPSSTPSHVFYFPPFLLVGSASAIGPMSSPAGFASLATRQSSASR